MKPSTAGRRKGRRKIRICKKILKQLRRSLEYLQKMVVTHDNKGVRTIFVVF